MKHLLTLFVLFFLSFQSNLYSQLPDGSVAPNWTLTDINGNSHTLYNLLAQGKMVVLEFSATWCGPCWNYMQTGALETFWEEHGPNGDNSAQVYYIESDWSTGMADLLGQTPASQGNWVANMDFPIIDLPSGNPTANQYGITYYPTLYAVCHDHTLYELGQVPASVWEEFIESCNMEAEQGDIEPALCVGEGSASVEVSGGHLPYSYQWSNGAHTQTISGLASGAYQVTVTEANGKISKVDFFVPGATTPVAISGTSIDPTLCYGSSNGSIEINVQGGTPGYQYDWSNGSSSQDLHNVPADVYTLTITDNNGCELTQSFTIDEPDLLEATVEATPDNCDQGDGTIILSIEGGVGNYVVYSSEGTVFGHQILDLPAGNVDVEVNDDNGCVWTEEVIIGIQDAPAVDLVQGANLSCTQTSTSISGFPSGGYGDYNFHWTTTDGHIIGNPNLSVVNVDAAGTYTLLVTDIFSGCVNSAAEYVQSNVVLPVVDAGQEMQVTCENLQVTVAGSGDPVNTISWNTANGHIVSGGNTYHPVVNAPGTYYIQVTNPVTNCINEDSMVVANGLNPAASAFQYISSGLTINATDISTGSNVSGWTWTFGDGGTSTEANVVHTYTAPGTYEVCLSVQNGCGVNQACQSVAVTSTGSVILVDAAVTDVVCFGESTGSITLNVNGGSGVYTYTWTGPDTTFTTSSIQDIPAGEYQLVITDDQGNIFINGYTVNQPTQVVLESSTVVDNLCFGQSNGSISIVITGGVAPYLYSWNGAPPQADNFLNQLPGGAVQAEVTDANGCKLLAGTYAIFEPDQLIPQSQITNEVCHGDANGSISLSVTGGVAPYAYLWNFNGSTDPLISGLPAGIYPNSITDANGCNIVYDAIVTEPAAIEPETILVTNASGPDQHDGSITIEPTGGTAPYQVAWNNGATGTSINGLAPGSYTYVITDVNGCKSEASDPILVNFSTGISEVVWPEYVTITPNPTKGDAIIKWSSMPSLNATLSILNVDGKMIGSHLMSSITGEWDLTSMGLTEGLYIILLKQDNQVYPFKLIVL
ncbi:MAG TPA: PKD domain-containing protein [Saprospiraceae bacterium]|nr:PKD domain-containing protein [Saprospiraceae bacterium]